MSKSIIIYDASTIPEGVAFDEVMKHCREEKVLVWDSSKGGKEPRVVDCEEGKEFDIQEIKDVNYYKPISKVIKVKSVLECTKDSAKVSIGLKKFKFEPGDILLLCLRIELMILNITSYVGEKPNDDGAYILYLTCTNKDCELTKELLENSELLVIEQKYPA